MKRWHLWPVVLAGGLATVVYALERLLAVDPMDALVDATVAAFHQLGNPRVLAAVRLGVGRDDCRAGAPKTCGAARL